MARILYGVMEDGHGHVALSLAVASLLPEHEFHFIGGARLAEAARHLHPLTTVPAPNTIFRNGRASLPATCVNGARCLAAIPRVRRQLLDLIESWQPDLAVSDREFYLPIAARATGLPCISIDHGRIQQACRYPVPASQRFLWAMTQTSDRLLFEFEGQHLIFSFFHPPRKSDDTRYELFPALLRPAVRQFEPTGGEHVLVYQTAPGPILRDIKRPVIIYGARNERAAEGNFTYKPFDASGILEDLAGCAYAIVNGGHTLICEALYYGKPVFCLPLENHFEQFLNAWYVRELGYGDFSTSRAPSLPEEFERRLNQYRTNIARQFVDGTPQLISRVREIIAQHAGARPKAFTPCQPLR